jgi:CHASE3 domain sensor protein
MKFSIGQKVMVGFAVALLLIGIVVTTFVRSMSHLMSATQWVSHSRQVIGALDKLSADLDGAETGQRSYLITGDESDLDPYHKALEKVSDNVAELRKLTADNRRQQASLDTLEPQVAQEMAMLKEAVDARKTRGFEAAQQIVLANRRTRTTDQVTRLINEMKAQERELVTQRSQAARSSGRRAIYVIISGSILALLVVPWAAFVIHREMARRKKAEAALEQHDEIQKSILDSMGDGVRQTQSQRNGPNNTVPTCRTASLHTQPTSFRWFERCEASPWIPWKSTYHAPEFRRVFGSMSLRARCAVRMVL